MLVLPARGDWLGVRCSSSAACIGGGRGDEALADQDAVGIETAARARLSCLGRP